MEAEERAAQVFDAEGLVPRSWSNEPGFEYAAHAHPYDKVLVCVAGSISFHTPEGNQDLEAGDRLDIRRGTRHSATVGPQGVTCWEAAR